MPAPWITRPSASFGAGYPNPAGGTRAVNVLFPNGYRTDILYPFVFIGHHYGDSGPGGITRMLMSEAPCFDSGVFLCAPTGLTDAYGNAAWNWWDTGAGPRTDHPGFATDDDYFYNGILVPAVASLNIDPNQIYLEGYSNGAIFFRKFAWLHNDKITSIHTFSGSDPVEMTTGVMANSVPSVNYHGDADGTVVYAGDPTGAALPGSLNGHGVIGAVATADNSVARNGVVGAALGANLGSIDLVTTVGGAETQRLPETPGTDLHSAAEQWKAPGAGHTLGLTANMGQYCYAWMARNHRGA
jgi:poly(3-hydroxybutyrate) depolymerase